MLIRTQDKKNARPLRVVLSILFVLTLVGGYFFYRWIQRGNGRTERFFTWYHDPTGHPEWAITSGEYCGDGPFSMPTSGFIQYLWDESFRPGHRHQGIDIFGGTESGVTPVYASYAGYLTRLSDWKSTVIIRIPSDPLNPSRQIWTYYTHMADEDGTSYIDSAFPPGTVDGYVEEGTLLGYQGNYSGDPNNPTGVHLHFSIVKDDGNGQFLNEVKIRNTLDPSPYLGLPLNGKQNSDQIAICNNN
jgi:murein DD-endopeptidase MepM/ murein hydrolase activator NlpD